MSGKERTTEKQPTYKIATLGGTSTVGAEKAPRDASEKTLIALQAFTGLTAAAGGILLLARPDGSLLQITPSALAALASNSPFTDFQLPGLLLAAGIGGGMIAAAMLLWRRRPYALDTAIAAGGALVIFEIVEYGAIGFMPLQAVEALVGLLILGLAARRRFNRLQPTSRTASRVTD